MNYKGHVSDRIYETNVLYSYIEPATQYSPNYCSSVTAR